MPIGVFNLMVMLMLAFFFVVLFHIIFFRQFICFTKRERRVYWFAMAMQRSASVFSTTMKKKIFRKTSTQKPILLKESLQSKSNNEKETICPITMLFLMILPYAISIQVKKNSPTTSDQCVFVVFSISAAYSFSRPFFFIDDVWYTVSVRTPYST